ncbi:MAG: thiamine-phosphate kinase [Candidatus Binataceae bacterium]
MTNTPGEFELIARLCAGLRMSRRTLLGPGDDCAVLARPRHRQVFTIDSLVEDVHFKLRWFPPAVLGARSLEVNLSDVASMGGSPTACVVNLAVRRGLDARFFDRLYAGLRARAKSAGVDVVGGNVTRADRLSITIAVVGQLRGAALRRDAARVGDDIFVTGTLGDAAAGWRILDGRLAARGATRRFLIGRFLSPNARIAAGARLARMRPAPAAIDVSDGLIQDLGHICERSQVGATLDPDALPLSAQYRAVMRMDRSLALGGGEDYELLFCLRPGHDTRALSRAMSIGVTRIGRITRGGGVKVPGMRGAALTGFDQLKNRA